MAMEPGSAKVPNPSFHPAPAGFGLSTTPTRMDRIIELRSLFFVVTVLAAAWMASACGDTTGGAASTKSATSMEGSEAPIWRNGGIKDAQLALDQLSTTGKGFVLGSPNAGRVAYVIFDPRCPHCAALWAVSKPVAEEGAVRFVWIPVAAISNLSAPIAAALLESANPIAAMDAHEASMAAKKGGLQPTQPPTETARNAIAFNTELVTSLGLQEVPVILTKGTSGTAVASGGSLTQSRLREFLAR